MIDIDKLIKNATLLSTTLPLQVYRAIKTKMVEFKSAKNAKEYTEVEELQLLDKMRKERLDSAKQYADAGRHDLAMLEELEAEILGGLLPPIPDEGDIWSALRDATAELGFVRYTFPEGASEEMPSEYGHTLGRNNIPTIYIEIPKKEMGRVIKLVKEKLPLADGKMVSEIVKGYLV